MQGVKGGVNALMSEVKPNRRSEKLKVGKDFSGVKLIQLNSAVYFSEKFSELCSNISRVPGETFQSS